MYIRRNVFQLLARVDFISLAVLVFFANSSPGTAQERERPPVSWVNPLPTPSEGLSHFELDSAALGHRVGYVVWTPPGYDPNGSERYPVIYFLHGMGGNESMDAIGFSSLVRRGIENHWLPASICVFPNGGQGGYRGQVEAMIIDELIPHIDSTYHTVADQKGRAVAGFSMGGQGAVRLSILHPHVFCAAGSWGGGLRQGAQEVSDALATNSETLKNASFAALLVNGDQDRPDAYTALAKQMTDAEIESEIVILVDTPHNLGRYYHLNAEQMLRFLGRQLQR